MAAAILLLAASVAQAQVLSDGSRVDGVLTIHTEINGAVLTAGDNVRAAVGGIQIRDSRVEGDIEATLKLNGAVLVAGENVTVLANSRAQGDTSEYTEVNGAVLAAGQDIDVQVGGVRIEDSRVRGDIDSYTKVNEAVLAAASNAQRNVSMTLGRSVGGISVE